MGACMFISFFKGDVILIKQKIRCLYSFLILKENVECFLGGVCSEEEEEVGEFYGKSLRKLNSSCLVLPPVFSEF